MLTMFAAYEEQHIKERDELLRDLELKYIHYIHTLLNQKLFIAAAIRRTYDNTIKQIRNTMHAYQHSSNLPPNIQTTNPNASTHCIINQNNKQDIECSICHKRMKQVMAKDVYSGIQCICDGKGCEMKMSGTDIVYHCNHGNDNKNGFDLCAQCIHQQKRDNDKYKEIKKAASTFRKPMVWKEWEKTFISDCYKQYKNGNLSKTQKYVEITCKLNKYTETMRHKNDPKPPWRTTKAVQGQLHKTGLIATGSKNSKKQKPTRKRKKLMQYSTSNIVGKLPPKKKSKINSKSSKRSLFKNKPKLAQKASSVVWYNLNVDFSDSYNSFPVFDLDFVPMNKKQIINWKKPIIQILKVNERLTDGEFKKVLNEWIEIPNGIPSNVALFKCQPQSTAKKTNKNNFTKVNNFLSENKSVAFVQYKSEFKIYFVSAASQFSSLLNQFQYQTGLEISNDEMWVIWLKTA